MASFLIKRKFRLSGEIIEGIVVINASGRSGFPMKMVLNWDDQVSEYEEESLDSILSGGNTEIVKEISFEEVKDWLTTALKGKKYVPIQSYAEKVKTRDPKFNNYVDVSQLFD